MKITPGQKMMKMMKRTVEETAMIRRRKRTHADKT